MKCNFFILIMIHVKVTLLYTNFEEYILCRKYSALFL